MELKIKWNEYLEKLHKVEPLSIEEHISMALKVGDLLRENERLNRCIDQLGTEFSKVVDERNELTEEVANLKRRCISNCEQ